MMLKTNLVLLWIYLACFFVFFPLSRLQNGRSTPCSPEHGGRLGVEGGYCCVYLPDGSASLAPTRNGQLIKDMLASLCEKRAFPLKDVVIYFNGKDKVRTWPLCTQHHLQLAQWKAVGIKWRKFFLFPLQQPLALDQDCSILRDQQVTLELRVTFAWVIILSASFPTVFTRHQLS